MKRIKVLNIVDEFHPDAGYENNVLSKFMVKLGYDYQILTTTFVDGNNYMNFLGMDNIAEKDQIFTKNTGVKITRLHIKKRISGRAIWNLKEFLKTINTINPDILFFCGNDTLIFIRYILKFKRQIKKGTHKYKIIADSHMLDMASRNRLRKVFYLFYKLFVTPILIKAKIKIIRVQDDEFVQKRLGIPLSQCPFLSFGTDTTVFYKNDVIKKENKKLLNICEDAFVFLYAGKINESKGGMLLAESLFKKIYVKKPITFVVLANAKNDYEKMVIEKLRNSENKVLVLDTVPYSSLWFYYQMTDVAIFPKQCSLSFYDLQACGVPVILENNNINRDRLKFENGFIYDGTVIGLRNVIKQVIELDSIESYSSNAVKFIQNEYDYRKISLQYDAIFKNLLTKK